MPLNSQKTLFMRGWESKIMVMNADIQMLKVFQFEIRSKLKVAPFDNIVKRIMLDSLLAVHLPMHKYSRVANNVAFVDFEHENLDKWKV